MSWPFSLRARRWPSFERLASVDCNSLVGTRSTKEPPASPPSPVVTCELSTKPRWLWATVPTPSAAVCSSSRGAEIVSCALRSTCRLAKSCGPAAAFGAGVRSRSPPEAPESVFGWGARTAVEAVCSPPPPPSEPSAITATTISAAAAAKAGTQSRCSRRRGARAGLPKPPATRFPSSCENSGRGSGESARNASASCCNSRSRGSAAVAAPSARAASIRSRSVSRRVSGPLIARLPQLLHRAVQLRADVRLTRSQHARDLHVREAGLELERHEVAVLRVERRERGTDGLAPHDALGVVLGRQRVQVLR